jgi:hypothetical protein
MRSRIILRDTGSALVAERSKKVLYCTYIFFTRYKSLPEGFETVHVSLIIEELFSFKIIIKLWGKRLIILRQTKISWKWRGSIKNSLRKKRETQRSTMDSTDNYTELFQSYSRNARKKLCNNRKQKWDLYTF